MASKPNHAWRSRLYAALLALVLPLSTIAAWGVATVTDTSRWVATLHPLASNATVTQYIATQGAETLIKDFHVEQRINQALPKQASFLASTITTELQRTIATALNDAINTQAFGTIWDKENQITHSTAVLILQGRANSELSTARSVVLNVTPTILSAIKNLDAQGITFFDPLKKTIKNDKRLILKLLNLHELQQAQYWFHLATTLQWILPIITLLLALAVIVSARPRRNGFRRLAVTVMLSCAVTYALLRIGIVLAAPLAPTPPDVTTAILNAITSFLAHELLLLMALGALGLALHWISGHSTRAIHLREQLDRYLKTAGRAALARSREVMATDWRGWTAENRSRVLNYLAIVDVGVVLMVVALLIWVVQSVSALLFIATIAILWFWLSRRARRRLSASVEPDATAPK